MIPLNYHHLYYFYVIAKAGSVTKACETLLLAQSTLSAQLKQLEKALGRPLFNRVNQKLSLTDDGRLVLDYAESIFEMGRELQDTLRDRPLGGQMVLQVGIMTGTSSAFGQALVESVIKISPTAHIVIHEDDLDDLLNLLRQQKLDIILTDVHIRSQEQEEFSNQMIGKSPVVLAVAKNLARRYTRIPADLQDARFILPSSPRQVYYKIQDLFAQWKIKPNIILEVQDVDLARRLVVSGLGIAPMSVHELATGQSAERMTILGNERSLGIFESVYLVTRKRKWPNPLAEHLMKKFRI